MVSAVRSVAPAANTPWLCRVLGAKRSRQSKRRARCKARRRPPSAAQTRNKPALTTSAPNLPAPTSVPTGRVVAWRLPLTQHHVLPPRPWG